MVVTATRLPAPEFWRDKRVLITGHTGFKGSWLAFWLRRLGSRVSGIALPPDTVPSLYTLLGERDYETSIFCDVLDPNRVANEIHRLQPEIVFHLAAQPLVRQSFAAPLDTLATNIMGTANVLDALRAARDLRCVVAVTSDKVYDNREWYWPYREDDRLGGYDPYSASKAACELVIDSYRRSFLSARGVAVSSARAGNVIGGGDWAADRLLPDAIRAWQDQAPLHVRRPHAVRPWQHVLEPLGGYLALAESSWHDASLAGAYNFGPRSDESVAVGDLVEYARAAYGAGEAIYATQVAGPHEAAQLRLDASKARQKLGVAPRWTIVEAIGVTMQWYRDQARGIGAAQLCERDIDRFVNASSEVR
jgi:CDP-glucose 4,6-dehydratase